MTTLAKTSICTLVHILICMTCTTLFWRVEFVGHFRLVAGLTHDALVCALQFEMRLRAVIELPRLPVFSEMATFAARTELTFMHVVFGVTGRATGLRIFEITASVTLFAAQRRMRAKQREPYQIVIKFYIH